MGFSAEAIRASSFQMANPARLPKSRITKRQRPRLADAPDSPKNTASRLLRIMRLLICRKWTELQTLISYQDTEVHTGGIYKAAGWTLVAMNKDGEWNRPNRTRAKAQSGAPKNRWEMNIAASAASPRNGGKE